MTNREKLFLLALENMTPDQLEELLAIVEKKGVPLGQLVEEAINERLTREFEEWEEGDA